MSDNFVHFCLYNYHFKASKQQTTVEEPRRCRFTVGTTIGIKKGLKVNTMGLTRFIFIVWMLTLVVSTKTKRTRFWFSSSCCAPVVESRESCATLGRSSALLLGISRCHIGDRCAPVQSFRATTVGYRSEKNKETPATLSLLVSSTEAMFAQRSEPPSS